MKRPYPTRPTGFPFEVVAVAFLFAAVLVEIFVTYTRLPAAELYHVSGTGLEGGASRVLVELNFPTALVAIAVLALLADRLGGRAPLVAAAAGIVLCAAVFWPGVVDQADLDAKPVNVIAALGVGVTVALAVFAVIELGRPRRPAWRDSGDVARVVVAVAALLLAPEWIAADLGLFFNGVPILGSLYQTGELRTTPSERVLHPAVHHGHHHGMDGVLLVLSALLLSRLLPSVRRPWLRAATGAYLALMLAYGIGELANDFWTEQVVKRGWTDWAIPDVTRPKVSIAWGVVLLCAACVFAVGAWRATRAQRPIRSRAVPMSSSSSR